MADNKEKTICDILKFEGVMSKGFGMAPRLVMRDVRLSIEAKAIYCYFQSFAGSAEKAFPKRDTILNELKISKNRYYKYLQELIDYDYVRVERDADQNNWKGRNIYVIVANPQSDNAQPPEREKVSSEPTGKAAEEKTAAACQPVPKKKATGSLYRKLEIPALLEKYPEEKKLIRSIYAVIKDMDTSEELKIGGAVKKKEALKELIGQLTQENIIAVLKSIKDNKEKINNKRAWIQVCLVNSLYDDELDEKVQKFNARYEAGTAKAAEADSRKKARIKEEQRERIPFLAEKEKKINSLYAQMARGKLYGDTHGAESLSRQIKAIEEEMKEYIYDKGIDPALYSFT